MLGLIHWRESQFVMYFEMVFCYLKVDETGVLDERLTLGCKREAIKRELADVPLLHNAVWTYLSNNYFQNVDLN